MLGTVGSALLAVGVAAPGGSGILIAAGIALNASCVVLASVTLVRSVGPTRRLRAVRERGLRLFQRYGYLCRAARFDELEEVHQYAVRQFGTEIITLARMQAWHRRNPEVINVIVPNGSDRIVGAFSVIPLNIAARRLLESNLLEARAIQASHIVTDPRRAACHYVSGVAGDIKPVQATAITRIEEQLRRLRSGHTVFTRPLTNEGLRLCKRYGFRPLSTSCVGDQLGCLYYLVMA